MSNSNQILHIGFQCFLLTSLKGTAAWRTHREMHTLHSLDEQRPLQLYSAQLEALIKRPCALSPSKKSSQLSIPMDLVSLGLLAGGPTGLCIGQSFAYEHKGIYLKHLLTKFSDLLPSST